MKCLPTVLLLACLGGARSSAQTIVRDTTVVGDSLLVRFPDATRYLVEVDQSLLRFTVHSLDRPDDPVLSTRVVPWQPGVAAQYEVYPRRAGDYVIRFTGGNVRTPIRFRIVRAPAAEAAKKPRSRFRLGFMLGGGIQEAQYLEAAECDACTDPDPEHFQPDRFYRWGREVELQLVLGSAGPWSFGVGATKTHRTNQTYGYALTIFVEPKFMPLTITPFKAATEIGVALRLGLVGAHTLPTSPVVTAPGLILRQHLDHRRGTEGWTIAVGGYLNLLWIHKQGDDHYGPIPQVGNQIDPRFTIQIGFAP